MRERARERPFPIKLHAHAYVHTSIGMHVDDVRTLDRRVDSGHINKPELRCGEQKMREKTFAHLHIS